MPSNSNKVHAKATNTIHYTLYYGTFIHTPALSTIEINFNTLVGVNEEGTIDFVHPNYQPSEHNNKSPIQFFIDNHHQQPNNNYRQRHHFEFVDYSHDLTKFFFPGFIDTHIHASQFPNNGIGLGVPLMDWLKTYTFPLEESFSTRKDKLSFATKIYSKVIQRTLENGTTCASYFTTIDPETSNLFAELLLIKGQRGFVGKVCMDHNEPYDTYQESMDDCIKSMDKIIKHVNEINPDDEKLVVPIITPRFAPVCSRELLKYLGDLSIRENLPIQTHISENKTEVELVRDLFPDCDSYASVYDKHDLLNKGTILAHAVHLTSKERKLIKEKNCSISHCPTSNTFISSGEAPVHTYLYNDGINVSLGTDVSGGFDSSILQVVKHAILVSHHLSMHKDDEKNKLSIIDGLYMATMGGAKAVGLKDLVGDFKVGKKFDAQLIDLTTSDSNVDVFSWQYPENGDLGKMNDLLGKWVFNGDDRNCVKVWCNGRLVINKERNHHRDDRWVITNGGTASGGKEQEWCEL